LGRRDRLPHALGDGQRHRQVGVGQDNRELLAAGARHQVPGPHPGRQQARHLAEDAVARVVAAGVVDPLEAVEVQGDHAAGIAVAPGAGQLVSPDGGQPAAVGEAGQGVLQGKRPQAGVLPL
jgi:hypothetical protein